MTVVWRDEALWRLRQMLLAGVCVPDEQVVGDVIIEEDGEVLELRLVWGPGERYLAVADGGEADVDDPVRG